MKVSAPTSIKELIQQCAPRPLEIIRGVVIQASPLEIQAINDDKLIINANTAIVPWYLTDYSTKCDIELGGGSILSHTFNDGQHPHGASGGHPQYSGDGVHSHPASEGAHVNWLQDFNVYGASIKHYNALREGETVFMLSFNSGKKYYVLDREEDFW